MGNGWFQRIRKRVAQNLRFEIEFSRVRRELEQVVDDTLGPQPMDSASRMLQRSGRRARIILNANLTFSGLKRGLVHVMRESVEEAPLHAPRDMARAVRRQATKLLDLDLGLPAVQQGLSGVLDQTLDLPALHASRRLVRNAHRRAKVVLKSNLTPSKVRDRVVSAVDESIEQIPLDAPRDFAKNVRRQAAEMLDSDMPLPEVPKVLGEALDLVPLHSPRTLFRNARRRAKVVLKANLKLSEMEQGLAQVVDEVIEQIPLDTPKGIARIVRHKATKALRTDVGMDGIARGLERTWNKAIEGMPLSQDLLVKQGAERSRHLNRQLAWSLAFIAGAVNAGGFLAVQTFTSHVTGVVSRAANEFVQGNPAVALAAVGVVVCFFAGAFSAGFLISLGRRHRFQAHYALSLMVEAVLLLLFGLMGARLHEMKFFLPATVALLSFVMGMHNSVVTVISNAEVRTTHLTGIVTDMGLEFSRLLYFNVGKDEDDQAGRIMGNRNKLILHSLILVSFFVGGLAGAVGFRLVGFKMTIFLAIALILLAWRPVLADIKIRFRIVKRSSDPIEAEWTSYVK